MISASIHGFQKSPLNRKNWRDALAILNEDKRMRREDTLCLPVEPS
jgi:hypothetical protein